MIEIFGSRVKVAILLYLGLRGGSSGRHLARILKISLSQIFKALHLLVQSKIVTRYKDEFYQLNPQYPYYKELLSMIQKEGEHIKGKLNLFMPRIAEQRKVDPLSVYQLLELRGTSLQEKKLSDVLRERYG